ncbi:MAG TPA: UvrD-helicase domain-containing protein [Syntrophomonas sp.]|nr:UvrD-helicase domain-containing protein [Syntrophomonas sp.]
MFIADFHIHSSYSRATSKECVPEALEWWARRKGLDLIGTGDFTHAAWREELALKLVPTEEGLYTLKDEYRLPADGAEGEGRPRFIVSGEISSIYKKNGKVRKIHNVILLPGLEPAADLARRLEAIGNLHSDGRPILGLDARDLLEITLDVCPDAIFIPAHIWTPHFSLFGAYSGFDDIRECFEDLTEHIFALETGLSSDPPMNWRWSALDKFTLVSNSDAHSPGNLAREANIFNTSLSYPHISQALQRRDLNEFYGTIEFFPEEGKYHCDGHRHCKVCFQPADTEAAAGVCPVCGGKITVGVLHRVEALADRPEGFVPPGAPHFERLVPLPEVIAASIGCGAASKKVRQKYDQLLHELGPELFILREAPLEDIELQAGPLVARGISRLRRGQVKIEPGYDGEYGKIKILDQQEISRLSGQLSLFAETKTKEPAAAPPVKAPASKRPSRSQAADDAVKNGAPASKEPTLDSEEERSGSAGAAATQAAASADMAQELNPQQWEAVSAAEPAIIVNAGPGTGKTKTLVSRIAYLVQECGVDPARITAVTFTNQAAGEMRERLKNHFGNRRTVKAMTIGTFHSICLKILSAQDGAANPTVIDEADALLITAEILKNFHYKNSPREVLRGISLIKNGAGTVGESAVPEGVYDLYCRRLAQYGVLDYDDILLRALEKFEAGGDEGQTADRQVRNALTHLLVDEFQDINDLQYRLIRAWSENSQSIFVIGDPDQSIYGFRGSDPRYFNQFQDDFPRSRQVKLTLNYRSTPEIIRCAGAVISRKAGERQTPSLAATRENGAPVLLLHAADEFSQAVSVAKEINRLVGGIDMLDAADGKRNTAGPQRGFSDIAVLYRTNRQAKMLEQCLAKEGIPYTVAGRDDFLFEREVKATLAFFRFLINPSDLVSLRTCMRTFGAVQDDPAEKLLADYAAGPPGLAALADIFQKYDASKTSDNWGVLPELMGKYEPLLYKEKAARLIEAFIQDSALPANQGLERLLHTALMCEGMEPFLQNLLLGRERDVVRSGSKNYTPHAVSLMTMHAAKGLEFPVVFLCGLDEGVIPYKNRAGDSDLNEERRLFYVAVTRARDELFLLTAGTPSLFLTDLPEDWLLKTEAFARRPLPSMEQINLFDKD